MKNLLPQDMQDHVQEELSVILNRESTDETLGTELKGRLREGIAALAALAADEKGAAMTRFAKQFNQYFEGQCIPLLVALDPETGLGYQLPEPDPNNPLLETLHIPPKTDADRTVSWTETHSLLLENWHSHNFKRSGVIRLKPGDIATLPAGGGQLSILGMSVLFRLSGERLIIESAGGNNAPALMGRFTVADPEIAEAARGMAKKQETQNPDVIFAEILHLSDPHTDNINRREHIWNYELPLTAISLLPEERQLELSDLYVTVHQSRVYLYSRKHRKVVVPRLTSAYNHNLNKLPLFRFLADLPYQYGRNSFLLDLRGLFPGLGFYPRVEYGDTILFEATWVLRGLELQAISGDSPAENFQRFQALRKELKLPFSAALAEGDQHLHFNFRRKAEVLFFLQCIRNKQEVILKEVISTENVRQYNAYLLPDTPIPLPPFLRFTHHVKMSNQLRRKFMPGSEWLYLKIYAPKAGASRMLLLLRPILRRAFSHGGIRKWFFIRYEDHAPHIRLRMQVNTGDITEILTAFKTRLEDRIRQHVVREYQVDVYSRELERYAFGGIERTEDFFWASSELVMRAISITGDKDDLHLFGLKSAKVIIACFIPDPDEQLSFCYRSYEQFLPEFGPVKMHVELDRKYRQLQQGINRVLDEKNKAYFGPGEKTAKRFLRSTQALAGEPQDEGPDRLDYLGSIVHMHLNRVFAEEARKQEMITYYLLYKYLLAVKGRNRQRK